ncbi:tryptophan 2,3-dioxygenase family protein [Streptomyces sp. NPDC049881]|uniref:tryptophan 2,3-dioxygenase n=1 Tax=unclassified Streptomyces TaxID=2593676 RepID=UPI00341FE76C
MSHPDAQRPDSPGPTLDFGADATPYEDYVHAETLTHLQQTLTDDPGEPAFLITTQVMELWFTLLVHEWRTACGALRAGDMPTALAALDRSAHELRALNASWEPLARLTPRQFNAFRPALGDGSGFQSAMYRRVEFLLGEKSASLLVPHRGSPRVHAELTEALHEPSLYDEALAVLARHGLAIPPEVLERDRTARYEPHPAVEAAWQRVYAEETPPLLPLGEALTEVAELVWRWRNDHLAATRRAMGGKQGTGGSAGVAWLEKRARQPVFPELWTARGLV